MLNISASTTLEFSISKYVVIVIVKINKFFSFSFSKICQTASSDEELCLNKIWWPWPYFCACVRVCVYVYLWTCWSKRAWRCVCVTSGVRFVHVSPVQMEGSICIRQHVCRWLIFSCESAVSRTGWVRAYDLAGFDLMRVWEKVHVGIRLQFPQSISTLV